MSLFKNRGVMLDPARLLEKRSYYEELLPWLKEWGYNLLHLHFADDQGLAIQLPSHPELSKPNAFSPGEMKSLIAKAKSFGLKVIPELESLGHTQFISRHPSYAHLGGVPVKNSCFNSLNPNHSETRVLLRDLLRDVAAIFPSDIIHAGLDEVNLGTLPEFSKLPPSEQWKAFAPHAIWVHEEIRKLGRRPAMWGDHLLHSPELAAQFEKDVLIFDWHYDAPFHPHSLSFFTSHGYEFWGCPASMQWNQKVLPTISNQFQNIREFTAHAIAFRNKGCTGMVNTIWCPWRYLSGVMDLPMAFGGHIFSVQEEAEDFCESFVRSFYGLPKAAARDGAAAIWHLHEIAPTRWPYLRLTEGTCDGAPFNREDRRIYGVMAKEAAKAEKVLKPLVNSAPRNASRLNDYVLTSRILQQIGRFGASGGQPSSLRGIPALLKACDASWGLTRNEPWDIDDPGNGGSEWLLKTIKTLGQTRSITPS